MVPKVAGKGRSFKGAALYYLHDKGALTADRVAFAHTENLPTRDPDAAARFMAWTAMNADTLKARAGGSAKGRKLSQPVYTYSLSWAPGETPSAAEMIDAARETMRELGIQEHEALIVAHKDEPHPHVHVIVNRVHPLTGVAAKLSNDHLKLSGWAEAFERRQGQIRCEQRVENNARRRDGEFVKDRGSSADREFYRWRRERMREVFEQRHGEMTALDARHRGEREALFKDKEQRIATQRAVRKERARPYWATLYAAQRHEVKLCKTAQATVWTRLRYFLHTSAREYFRLEKSERSGFLKAAFHAAAGTRDPMQALERKHERQRATLSANAKREILADIKASNQQYRAELAALRERHAQEREQLGREQAAQSEQRARAIKSGEDREEHREQLTEQRRRDIRENARDLTEARAPGSGLTKSFKEAGRPSASKVAQEPETKEAELDTPPTEAERLEAFRRQAAELADRIKGRSVGRDPKQRGKNPDDPSRER